MLAHLQGSTSSSMKSPCSRKEEEGKVVTREGSCSCQGLSAVPGCAKHRCETNPADSARTQDSDKLELRLDEGFPEP